jgi:large conductance mechanosensitive channel
MTVGRGRDAALGFFAEFKQFILQGNVIDLAVAVIIGGAFGKIIESLVADVITPAILTPALKAAKVDELAKLSLNGILYGKFLASVLNFIVIAFCIFVIIRLLQAFKREEAAVEEAAAPDPNLLAQERLTGAIERLTQVMESQE